MKTAQTKELFGFAFIFWTQIENTLLSATRTLA